MELITEVKLYPVWDNLYELSGKHFTFTKIEPDLEYI